MLDRLSAGEHLQDEVVSPFSYMMDHMSDLHPVLQAHVVVIIVESTFGSMLIVLGSSRVC